MKTSVYRVSQQIIQEIIGVCLLSFFKYALNASWSCGHPLGGLRTHFHCITPTKSWRPIRAKTHRKKVVSIRTSDSILMDFNSVLTMAFKPAILNTNRTLISEKRYSQINVAECKTRQIKRCNFLWKGFDYSFDSFTTISIGFQTSQSIKEQMTTAFNGPESHILGDKTLRDYPRFCAFLWWK